MKPFRGTGVLVPVKVTQYLSVLGLQGNILVAGLDYKGGLCEERLGLPFARRRQSQRAPLDPPQSTAELLSQGGAASRKIYLRNGKKPCRTVEREK